ncbi:MAG TPA: hypothetical protein DCY13_16395 [Verrucomicrobiales bacterium]|nr:hypothetical protein [Verrucomicrobiales bacterium]
MMTRLAAFNMKFLLALVLAAGGFSAGCSSKEDKKISTIRLHLEVNPQMVRRSHPVPILRGEPVMVNVEDVPFLYEAYVDQAEVVQNPGGYEIKLVFNKSGSWLLENITADNQGKRIAIMAQFPESRWLAAPIIRGRIAGGVLQFVPDASLEETRRIVDGLNLTIEKRKRNSWGS